MYQFNPIDGSAVNGGFTELSYPIRQISVLQPGADFLRSILLLDRNNAVHVFPESASETVNINIQYSHFTFHIELMISFIKKKYICNMHIRILIFRHMERSRMYRM